MPTVIREKRPTTPLQRAAAAIHAANLPDAPRKHKTKAAIPPPEFGPAVDVEALPDDLLYTREGAYAMCVTLRLRHWLFEAIDPVAEWHDADRTIRLDHPDLPLPFALLSIYVEATLKSRILFPDCRNRVEFDDAEDTADDLQLSEADAKAAGLMIRRRKRPAKEKPSLPGCQGFAGEVCMRLRHVGERFCPTCRKKELDRLRNSR